MWGGKHIIFQNNINIFQFSALDNIDHNIMFIKTMKIVLGT